MSDEKKVQGNPAHSGTVLRQVLGNTSKESAASWFGITKEELEKLLKGECAMSKEIAQKVHELLGTGRTPWVDSMLEQEGEEVAQIVDAGGIKNLRDQAAKTSEGCCSSKGGCCSKK